MKKIENPCWRGMIAQMFQDTHSRGFLPVLFIRADTETLPAPYHQQNKWRDVHALPHSAAVTRKALTTVSSNTYGPQNRN